MYVAPEIGPANDAFAASRYVEAAQLYERAAYSAHQAKELLGIKAASLMAVKAWAYGGDGANALRFATSVIDLFKTIAQEPDIRSYASKTLAMLRDQGLHAYADTLSAHVGAVVPTWTDPNAPQLPASCGTCGALVKPAEVVRPTPSTVACKYCGASLAR
jgi:hypothetical protein